MSLVTNPVGDHHIYSRIVGEYQGLQWVLDAFNEKLAEHD